MPLLEITKPSRFKITAFLDRDRKRPVPTTPNILKTEYKPESLKIKQDNIFQNSQAISTSSAQARFHASRSRLLSVTLCFNGIDFGQYGAADIYSGNKSNLEKDVEKFFKLCQQINSSSHEPAFLKLSWGQAGIESVLEARLKDYELTYPLIGRDGKPLLAEIQANFIEDIDPKKQKSQLRLSSPDLTHRHLVLAGESLTSLCLKYYGSTDAYLQIAQINNLDHFSWLAPGIELYFPPLASLGGTTE